MVYFKFKGIKYGFCTKFILTDDTYKLIGKNILYGTEFSFSEYNSKMQILMCYVKDKNDNVIPHYVRLNQVKEITKPVYFGGITSQTQKLIDEQKKEKETGLPGSLTIKIAEQEKKSEERKADFEENFNAWMIYIAAMLVVTVFKANIFLWILFTAWFAIYKTYEHK